MSNTIKENCVSGPSACLDHCTMTTQHPGIWNSKQQVSTDLHEHTWTVHKGRVLCNGMQGSEIVDPC